MAFENPQQHDSLSQGSFGNKKIYSMPGKSAESIRAKKPESTVSEARSTKSVEPKSSEGTQKPDPWGTHQKMEMKTFSKGAKDVGIQSRTGIYEKEGKEILKKHFGVGFLEKSFLKKGIRGLEARSGHGLTELGRKEARRELKYIREIEKSLEKK